LFVARHASELPDDPAIVVTNPDEDCSPAAFRILIDELLAGPEPELESISAAEALRELRAGNRFSRLHGTRSPQDDPYGGVGPNEQNRIRDRAREGLGR
jgi:hypothetical protein